MLEYSQVVSSHKNGDSWTNVFQLGTPKHMPHLYPRHKQDQPIPLLSRGLGPNPNLDSKPPHLERVGTHDKRVTSLPAPISKYMLRIICLWPNYHPQQRTVLNRHEQRKQCNQVKPHWPWDTTCCTHQYPMPYPCLVSILFSSFYYESNNNHLLWVTAGYSRYRKSKHSSYLNLY